MIFLQHPKKLDTRTPGSRITAQLRYFILRDDFSGTSSGVLSHNVAVTIGSPGCDGLTHRPHGLAGDSLKLSIS